jgi:hypothetical protein
MALNLVKRYRLRLFGVLISAIILSVADTCVFAQEVERVVVLESKDAQGKEVYYLRYDLIAPHKNIACRVFVRYITRSRQLNLQMVKGDVGADVLPGTGKVITWDYVKELVHTVGEGEVTMSVEATPMLQASGPVKIDARRFGSVAVRSGTRNSAWRF